MVDGVNNVHSSSNEDPKKKILTEPLKASKIEISMVSADALKEDIDLDSKITKLKELKYSNKDIVNIINSLYDVNKNEIKKRLI